MKIPAILLSGKPSMEAYVEAIGNAGGIPTAEYCRTYGEEYDGLLLCGGVDVAPARYGQPVNGSGTPDVERDAAEFVLIEAFLQAGKPVFGICRGCQLINVWYLSRLPDPKYLLWRYAAPGYPHKEPASDPQGGGSPGTSGVGG